MRRVCLAQSLCILMSISGLVATTWVSAQEIPPEEPEVTPNEVMVDGSEFSSTADDLSISTSELRLRVRPLTLEELQAEAEIWHELLKNKALEVASAEIALLSDQKAVDEMQMAALFEEQRRLVERFQVVLASLEQKGGEVEEYKQYVASITGIILEPGKPKQRLSMLRSWLRSPEGGLRILKQFGLFAVALLITYLVAKIVAMIVSRATSATGRMSALLRDFVVTWTSRAILIVGFVMALSTLGVDIGPLIAALGAAGFAVAFALRDTLSNLASGIMILVNHPFDVGDVVEVAGVKGRVESLTLVSTKIRTFDNQVMFIPNNSVWENVITNAVGSTKRRVDMVFGIGYGDSHEKASRILEDIVKEHGLVLDNPEPVIKVHELGDSSVNLICRPWARTDDYWTVYWDVTRAVKERFDAEGVSIPFPQRDVHLYQASPGT